MAGIVKNVSAIWDFRVKVGDYEQAINYVRCDIASIVEDADYQIQRVLPGLVDQVGADAGNDDERHRAQRFLEEAKEALRCYWAARGEVLRLVGADSANDGSQSAQAYLSRLGQALEEYYGAPAISSADLLPEEPRQKILEKYRK